MADVSDPAAAAPVSYPLSRAPRDAELTSSSCLNTAIRYWPAPWLGSAPQQQQESAVLLQRGREELALGAARRHRHGEAQAVHGQIPHHQPGRAARAAWKDSRCPLAGQAQPEPKGIELERGKPPVFVGACHFSGGYAAALDCATSIPCWERRMGRHSFRTQALEISFVLPPS